MKLDAANLKLFFPESRARTAKMEFDPRRAFEKYLREAMEALRWDEELLQYLRSHRVPFAWRSRLRASAGQTYADCVNDIIEFDQLRQNAAGHAVVRIVTLKEIAARRARVATEQLRLLRDSSPPVICGPAELFHLAAVLSAVVQIVLYLMVVVR
ncbi:MAG: hypothetical protein KF901_17315 [Myxococcales bacterium]|nr:hypothetical protein [Myxococcales bacterium]